MEASGPLPDLTIGSGELPSKLLSLTPPVLMGNSGGRN